MLGASYVYLLPVLIGSALFLPAMTGQSTLVVVLLHSFENLSAMMMMMMMMVMISLAQRWIK